MLLKDLEEARMYTGKKKLETPRHYYIFTLQCKKMNTKKQKTCSSFIGNN